MRSVQMVIFTALVYFFSTGALAHQSHPASGVPQDYTKWMRPGTSISCCNKHDCRPVEHRFTNGALEMFLHGSWVIIPFHAILHDQPVEDRNAHWCGKKDFLGRLMHFCAVYPKGEVSLPPQVRFAQLNAE